MVGSATNGSLALLRTLAAVVAHDDEIRRTGQGRAHAALGVEVNGVDHLVYDGVDTVAASVDEVQGIQRAGDSADQLAVVLGLKSLVSPTGRLEVRVVCNINEKDAW